MAHEIRARVLSVAIAICTIAMAAPVTVRAQSAAFPRHVHLVVADTGDPQDPCHSGENAYMPLTIGESVDLLVCTRINDGSPNDAAATTDEEGGGFLRWRAESRPPQIAPVHMSHLPTETDQDGQASIRVTGLQEGAYDVTVEQCSDDGLYCYSSGPLTIRVSPPPQCNDGYDNDEDGRTDYPDDPDCVGTGDNAEKYTPNGLIAFDRACMDDRGNIALCGIKVIDPFNGEARDFVDGVDPRWSPDGSTLAFHGCIDRVCGLFLVDADGNNRRVLVRLSEDHVIADHAWSPSGSWLAFRRCASSSGSIARLTCDLWIVAPGTGELERLSHRQRVFGFVWAPDDSAIAYTRCGKVAGVAGTPIGHRSCDLWTAHLSNGTVTRLTDNRIYESVHGWPAEDLITFLRPVEIQDRTYLQVHSMDPQGGHRRRLTSVRGHMWDTDWTTTGDRFVTELERTRPGYIGYINELVVMNREGEFVNRIELDWGSTCCASFSPDGRQLLYGTSTGEEDCLVRHPLRRDREVVLYCDFYEYFGGGDWQPVPMPG